jgi:IS30 family transposase
LAIGTSHALTGLAVVRPVVYQTSRLRSDSAMQGDCRTRIRGWDRGKEMAAHKRFTMATDIQVFFCDPQSPWQRGSNENTNGLLRQYMPKGVDISGYSHLQLNAIARQLNERPRKTLGFKTPAEMFSESVALTS